MSAIQPVAGSIARDSSRSLSPFRGLHKTGAIDTTLLYSMRMEISHSISFRILKCYLSHNSLSLLQA